MVDKPVRILCLDGGGAKGFYTLGVLREIEALIGCRIHEHFDLIYGTSTGAIIAAMMALGRSINEIGTIYEEHVPTIMTKTNAYGRTKALNELSKSIFGETKFESVKTNIGIVATKWVLAQPMIFKGSVTQAHGRKSSFTPGFGVNVGDAVEASCSAYPYFRRKTVVTGDGDCIELVDGGFCANNPTLYAIADATAGMGVSPAQMRVLSIGVGTYPPRKSNLWSLDYWKKKTPGVQLLQKTLEINTQSMEQLRTILCKHIQTVRISQSFSESAMATDLFECDPDKLTLLQQLGARSFGERENELKALLF